MSRKKKGLPLSEVVARLLKVSAPTLKQYAEWSGIGYSTLLDWQHHADTPRARTPRTPNLDRLIATAERQRDELDQLLAQLRAARSS